jgi:hypothetical protein
MKKRQNASRKCSNLSRRLMASLGISLAAGLVAKDSARGKMN